MRRPLNASHCAGGAARAHVRTAGVNYKMRPLAFREINALSNCFSIRPRERGGGVARFFFVAAVVTLGFLFRGLLICSSPGAGPKTNIGL